MGKHELDNLEKYLNRLKQLGYDKLPQPDHVPTIDELAAEGHELLKQEGIIDLPPIETKADNKLEMALGKNSKNPYVRARVKVLTDMPLSRRERILKLEEKKDLDHPEYKAFVQMVIKLGNEFDNKDNDKNK